MKAASSGLVAYLNSNKVFYMADLYTFTLIDGTVFRHTSCDIDLTVAGNLFPHTGPKITRSNVKMGTGLEVDTLKLTVAADSGDLIAGQPFLQAIVAGRLDGAVVKLDRIFMPAWGDTSLGTVNLFTGHVADIQGGRLQMDISVKSDIDYLNMLMPRNVYQAPCMHILYGAGCTLTKSSFGATGTVGASPTTILINCGLTQAAGWFDLGTITFTIGVNNGVSRTVKSYTPGVFNLMAPLGAAPAPGDTFTAYAGCDKQQSTCTAKFNNLANFRGLPYIPVPETAY